MLCCPCKSVPCRQRQVLLRLWLQVGKPGELFNSCMDLYVKRQWPREVALALITINPATALKARRVPPQWLRIAPLSCVLTQHVSRPCHAGCC